MSDLYCSDVSYFQAKFGWERVKASKVILHYSKLSRFDKPFGGGLAAPWTLTKAGSNYCVRRKDLLPSVKGSCLSGICE